MKWSEWQCEGGILTAGPALASPGPGRLDCFIRGTEGNVYHRPFDGEWGPWENIFGRIIGEPAATCWGPDRVDCLVRGMDNHLWHIWREHGVWGVWTPLGGSLTAGPAVASPAPGRLDCFVKWADNHVYYRSFDREWGPWENLGGRIDSAPAAACWGPDRVDCVVQWIDDNDDNDDNDNKLWHIWREDGRWGEWQAVGALVAAGPALASPSPGRLDCFVKDEENRVGYQSFDAFSGEWSERESLARSRIDGAPAAVCSDAARVDCVVRGMDNHLWHVWSERAVA